MALPRKQRDALHHLEHFGFCYGAQGTDEQRLAWGTHAFQTAYNGPRGWLATDAVCGPKTRAAMQELPRLSPHFVVAEVWDRRERACFVHRGLLAGLEGLRMALDGKPLVLSSVCRTPATNRLVGGAKGSYHMSGYAADLWGLYDRELVYKLQLFSGLGLRDGRVSHVDVRHLRSAAGGPTPHRPSVWHY